MRDEPSSSVSKGALPGLRFLVWVLLVVLIAFCPSRGFAAETTSEKSIKILLVLGTVEVRTAESATWREVRKGETLPEGVHLRTGPRSRAAYKPEGLGVQQVAPETTLILKASDRTDGSTLEIESGGTYYYGRSPGNRFRTPTVAGGIRGTEFLLSYDINSQTTEIVLFDGVVDLTNGFGGLSLSNLVSLKGNHPSGQPIGQWASISPGVAPALVANSNPVSRIQWTFYYPAVLDPGDLGQLPEDYQPSLMAYRAGNPQEALGRLPAIAAAEGALRLFRAAVLIAAGYPDDAEVTRTSSQGTNFLDVVQAAVRGEELALPEPTTASDWLARSYYQQSRSDLVAARDSARRAAELSPDFGFAWHRLAELEFSFGRVGHARENLARGMALSPEYAPGLTLNGFLHAAESRYAQALAAFKQAIAVDGRFADAWLGRGLVLFRNGDVAEATENLMVAAALEPRRSVLRSYLGKAFHESGRHDLAYKELSLALALDPNDPTPWLYQALLLNSDNRVNEAIGSLEQSRLINTNRSVFRSSMLLDQDQAVRLANLARLYQDAGMEDVAFNEAASAVASDFANHSAHLFLATTYLDLLESRRSDLRYETPALNELLLANLLAPPGSPVISSAVTRQEYSRLFERDGPHIFSETGYRSGGDWSQSVSQSGRFGGTSYSVDYAYQSMNGEQPNGESERSVFSVQAKQQVTSRDSMYLQVSTARTTAGDSSLYYDPSRARLDVHSEEVQEPSIIAGLHREWSPGNHTLLLVGRIADRLDYVDGSAPQLLLARTGPGGPVNAIARPVLPDASLGFAGDLTLYTTELLQVVKTEHHEHVAGLRYQLGEFDSEAHLGASTATRLGDEAGFIPPFPPITFSTPASSQSQSEELHRFSAYYYHHWTPIPELRLTGGIAYDWVEGPANHLFPPLQPGVEDRDAISPKGGLVWTPDPETTLRFGFARALGGVSFDQSFRLEPSEVAGINQSFRSVIPNSVAGTTENAEFQNLGLSVTREFPSRTYLTLAAGRLTSETVRQVGDYQVVLAVTPANTREELRYREHTALVAVNQLLGDHWNAGLRYRLTGSRLRDDFPEIPSSVSVAAHTVQEATLHNLNAHLGFQSPGGFYGLVEADWYRQSNQGFNAAAVPGDEFYQANLHLGYRFLRRRVQAQLSLLNITNQDYRLNPLSLYTPLPRERMLAMQLRIGF